LANKPKYDYAAIRLDYESGLNEKEIQYKYDIPRTTLLSRIALEKWEVNESAKKVIDGILTAVDGYRECQYEDKSLAKNVANLTDTLIRQCNVQIANSVNALFVGLLDRSLNLAPETNELGVLNLAKAAQIITDTTGLSERHKKSDINNTMIENKLEIVRNIKE